MLYEKLKKAIDRVLSITKKYNDFSLEIYNIIKDQVMDHDKKEIKEPHSFFSSDINERKNMHHINFFKSVEERTLPKTNIEVVTVTYFSYYTTNTSNLKDSHKYSTEYFVQEGESKLHFVFNYSSGELHPKEIIGEEIFSNTNDNMKVIIQYFINENGRNYLFSKDSAQNNFIQCTKKGSELPFRIFPSKNFDLLVYSMERFTANTTDKFKYPNVEEFPKNELGFVLPKNVTVLTKSRETHYLIFVPNKK